MTQFKPFAPDQYDLLLKLRAEGKSWTEIGNACGHSANSCSSTYSMRNRAGHNQTTNPWTPEQLALLKQLAEAGKSWDQCAEVCGHSANSCKVTYHVQRRAEQEIWTELDMHRLRQMRDVGHKSFSAIARELGRTTSACNSKYWTLLDAPLITFQPDPGMRVSVTPEQLADRDARARLRYMQSPAAALMGEPLPGRSALDLRRQGEAQ